MKLVNMFYLLIWPIHPAETDYQDLAIKVSKPSNQKPLLAHLISIPIKIKHLILSPGLYLYKLPFSYVLCLSLVAFHCSLFLYLLAFLLIPALVPLWQVDLLHALNWDFSVLNLNFSFKQNHESP